MKLSCFFLSSICRVAASIICLICGKTDSEFSFATGIQVRINSALCWTQPSYTDLEFSQHPRALRWRAWNDFGLILNLLKPWDAPLLDARGFLGHLRVITKHILM